MRRIVAAIVGALAVILLCAGPAGALPGVDCAPAPSPETPGQGVTGIFGATQPKAPTKALVDQYGWAGLSWHTYDTGCLGSPTAAVTTSAADTMLSLATVIVAGAGAVMDAAYHPTMLGVFDPIVASTTEVLRKAVLEQWLPLALAALGLLIMWRARSARLSHTAVQVASAVAAVGVAAVLARWPVVAGHAADTAVTVVMGQVDDAAGGGQPAGEKATGALYGAILYPLWLSGEVGSSTSPVAAKYGAALLDGQAYTWTEAAGLTASPDTADAVRARKADKWKATADQVKATDPAAYEALTGQGGDRLTWGFLALLAALAATPFLAMAAGVILAALLIVRVAVILSPVLALLAVLPATRRAALAVVEATVTAVLNALVIGVITAVMVLLYGVIATAAVPVWLAATLMVVLTVVAWVVVHPFRRLGALTRPWDVRRSARDVAGAVQSTAAATTAVAYAAAGAVGDAVLGAVDAGAERWRDGGRSTRVEAVTAVDPDDAPESDDEVPEVNDVDDGVVVPFRRSEAGAA